jgi:formamidopyrimidine-DNA glycosylase
MPELPDLVVYTEALERRILDRQLLRARVRHPNLLRTADPPLSAVEGRRVVGLRRLGKRIAIGVEGELWLVLHLMIAGRLHWRAAGATLGRRVDLGAFDFAEGTLVLSEAAAKKRASLHLVREAALAEHDPGGVEPLACDLDAFARSLTATNHTLKRALTDPRLVSGIGNAYSDEILHRARLSPVALTRKLSQEAIERLFAASRDVLAEWTERLRAETGHGFPEKVTAFRDGMAVHGRYGQPCPACGSKVQRIRYASNEANYCARCQTGGKLLADRVLSRLLKKDWPKTPEELEERRRPSPQ